MEYQKAFNQETVVEYPSFKNAKKLSWNTKKILWNTKKLLLTTRRHLEHQARFMKPEASTNPEWN